METEQMAAVSGSADHRQGGAYRPSVKVERTAKIQTGSPILREDLVALVETIPDGATIEITPVISGSQREPHTTGYRLVASW